ncbi:MAG: prepilin peptidase [Pirellulaceae bacterium]
MAVSQPLLPLWALEPLAHVLLGAWLFAMGASVGSFLNVVVYRLPRGMNLVHPGSHCPQCGHAIRPRDNIPLWGWLWLRARCRDCQSPIAPRYYYVELVVALLFLLVAIFEAYLPRDLHGLPGDFGRLLLTRQQTLPFWCAYATHVVLATTLIAATLIDFDGCRTPRRLFWPVLLMGLCLPLFWPEIRPLPLGRDLPLVRWQAGLADGLAGLAAGTALGGIAALGWRTGARGQAWPKFAPLAMLAAVGVVLGWQRMLPLVPLATLIHAGVIAISARRQTVFPLAAVVLALALPQLVESGWNLPLADIHGRWEQIAAGLSILGTGLFAWLAGRIAPPQYFARPDEQPPSSAGDAVAVDPPLEASIRYNLP